MNRTDVQADASRIWTEVDNQYTCEHERITLRYADQSNGTRAYWEQCLRCGDRLKRVPKNSLDYDLRQRATPYNNELHNRWYAERRNEYERRVKAQRQNEDQRWHEWYQRYLLTDAWRRRREMVIKRANGVCQGCEMAPATQVHHLTYRRVGDEMLFDLVAICRPCHERISPTE